MKIVRWLKYRNIIYDKCLHVSIEHASEIDDLVEDVVKCQRDEHIRQIDKFSQ